MVFTVDIDEWFLPRHKCPEREISDPGIKVQAPPMIDEW
jgi:hypothetical protein